MENSYGWVSDNFLNILLFFDIINIQLVAEVSGVARRILETRGEKY